MVFMHAGQYGIGVPLIAETPDGAFPHHTISSTPKRNSYLEDTPNRLVPDWWMSVKLDWVAQLPGGQLLVTCSNAAYSFPMAGVTAEARTPQ